MNERTGRIGQTKIYVQKFYRIFLNEKDWKTLIFAVIISLILASVFGDDMFHVKEDTRTAFFAIVSSCIWIGIFNSIQIVCRERQIIKREHRTGLHITSYVAAHLICQAAVCIIQAASMVFIYSLFLDFPKEGLVTGSFLADVFITFFLVVYSSDVLGIAVSSLVKNTTSAMTVMPFILIVELIFSGSIFPLSGPLRTVSDWTISKWGQRVLCIEANMNELPTSLGGSQVDLIKNIDVIKEISEYLPDDTMEMIEEELEREMYDYMQEYTRKKIYKYDKNLVTKRWMTLVWFTLLYAAVSVASLELIDRDKR